MKYTAIIWGVLLFLCSACEQKTEVTSPDGRNKLMLMLDESGSLYYQIFSGGNEIVRSSLMGWLRRMVNIVLTVDWCMWIKRDGLSMKHILCPRGNALNM